MDKDLDNDLEDAALALYRAVSHISFAHSDRIICSVCGNELTLYGHSRTCPLDRMQDILRKRKASREGRDWREVGL